MRGPLRPVAPSLGDTAGRPRNGPDSKGRSYRQARRPAKFAAVRFTLIAQVNLQLPRERERRIKMHTTRLRTAFLFFAVSVVSFSLQAQTNSADAHLSGRVTDASGYTIAGVRITAQPENAPAPAASTSSAADGTFSLILAPGRYRIRFERDSFVPRDFILDLAAAESHKLDVRLQIERLSSSVVVTAQAEPTPLQETPATVTEVTREEIAQRQTVLVPDLLATQPGVAITRTGTVGGLTTVFLDGGNSSFVKVLVDGTPINLPGGDVDISNLTLDNVDKIEIV